MNPRTGTTLDCRSCQTMGDVGGAIAGIGLDVGPLQEDAAAASSASRPVFRWTSGALVGGVSAGAADRRDGATAERIGRAQADGPSRSSAATHVVVAMTRPTAAAQRHVIELRINQRSSTAPTDVSPETAARFS